MRSGARTITNLADRHADLRWGAQTGSHSLNITAMLRVDLDAWAGGAEAEEALREDRFGGRKGKHRRAQNVYGEREDAGAKDGPLGYSAPRQFHAD
jgi:hypothetical protein